VSENPAAGVIQQLQAQLRAARIETERHKLEADDLRRRVGKPDPRLERLEAELKRVREELAELRDERDQLLSGVRAALDQLERG
jgi:chromosome segregation ATPase